MKTFGVGAAFIFIVVPILTSCSSHVCRNGGGKIDKDSLCYHLGIGVYRWQSDLIAAQEEVSTGSSGSPSNGKGTAGDMFDLVVDSSNLDAIEMCALEGEVLREGEVSRTLGFGTRYGPVRYGREDGDIAFMVYYHAEAGLIEYVPGVVGDNGEFLAPNGWDGWHVHLRAPRDLILVEDINRWNGTENTGVVYVEVDKNYKKLISIFRQRNGAGSVGASR